MISRSGAAAPPCDSRYPMDALNDALLHDTAVSTFLGEMCLTSLGENDIPRPVSLKDIGLDGDALFWGAMADVLVRAGYLERSGDGWEPTAKAYFWSAAYLNAVREKARREPSA
ncbi:MAG: hypothetical protein ACLQVI_17675 [Polyangiaceae bacterium]